VSNDKQTLNGFARGHDFQAAVDDALKDVAGSGHVGEYVVVRNKFTTGGVVGDATYVTLEPSAPDD
jgi:hypothetical protein